MRQPHKGCQRSVQNHHSLAILPPHRHTLNQPTDHFPRRLRNRRISQCDGKLRDLAAVQFREIGVQPDRCRGRGGERCVNGLTEWCGISVGLHALCCALCGPGLDPFAAGSVKEVGVLQVKGQTGDCAHVQAGAGFGDQAERDVLDAQVP